MILRLPLAPAHIYQIQSPVGPGPAIASVCVEAGGGGAAACGSQREERHARWSSHAGSGSNKPVGG